jgi:glucosamine-6-phosphate deaminase
MSSINSFEKILCRIFSDYQEGSKFAAEEIAQLIKQKQAEGKKAVLGLATGSTPKTLYAELIIMYKEEGLSFTKSQQLYFCIRQKRRFATYLF